jgi:hypothetical protein
MPAPGVGVGVHERDARVAVGLDDAEQVVELVEVGRPHREAPSVERLAHLGRSRHARDQRNATVGRLLQRRYARAAFDAAQHRDDVVPLDQLPGVLGRALGVTPVVSRQHGDAAPGDPAGRVDPVQVELRACGRPLPVLADAAGERDRLSDHDPGVLRDGRAAVQQDDAEGKPCQPGGRVRGTGAQGHGAVSGIERMGSGRRHELQGPCRERTGGRSRYSIPPAGRSEGAAAPGEPSPPQSVAFP